MFFDYKALDQELRKHLPCVFDIAVFCMSIYQWIVSPKQPKTSGWLFGFCFFVLFFLIDVSSFSTRVLVLSYYISAQNCFSLCAV